MSTSRSNTLSAILFFAFAIASVSAALAIGIGNAKDMFYQELKEPTKTSAGVAICLELHRPGESPVLCNNRYPFKSGDALRLHVKSSTPVYAYIALAAGSTGKKALLYPPPGSTEDNRLEAGKEYVVPASGQIVFDNNPGTEKLMLVFSPEKLDTERALSQRNIVIDQDSLTGIPQKIGDYSIVSNAGVYDPFKKEAGQGLVFVNNPDPSKPTAVSVLLNHGGSAPAPHPAPSPTPAPPGPTPPAPPKPSKPPADSNNREITDKWAFIVGINKFEKVNGLSCCVADAMALKDFLIKEAGFRPNHVLMLTDEEATTPNITHVMTKLLPQAIQPDDLVLLYFSTHGSGVIDKPTGQNYIITYDYGRPGTGISMQNLGEMIKEKIPSNRVVTILDTCFSGNARDLDPRDFMDHMLMGSGQIIVSSCGPNEYALEDRTIGHGYFTHYLIQAFRTKRALKASFDAAQAQVQEITKGQQPGQHPVVKYDRWKGNDVLLFSKPTNPRM